MTIEHSANFQDVRLDGRSALLGGAGAAARLERHFTSALDLDSLEIVNRSHRLAS